MLENFETRIWNLVKKLGFKNYPNRKHPYLRELYDKIKDFKKQEEVILFSDKTKNLYKINPKLYDRILQNEMCKKYKTVNDSFIKHLNIKAKSLKVKLGIADRTEPVVHKHPRITLKNHKKNFLTNSTFRLICPNSSDLGKVSKVILDKYLNKMKSKIELKLWSNIWESLDWFKHLDNKRDWKFIQVDIVDYYSSINEVIFNKALIFTQNKRDMTREEIDLS